MDVQNVESWDAFVNIAAVTLREKFVGTIEHGNVGYAFRGQSDESWGLKSSLLRRLPSGIDVKNALELESRAIREFQGAAHLHMSANEFSTTTDRISWLGVMQHHGAPTRLLDWTTSIYVAAYFAVHGTSEKNGAVWYIAVDVVDKYTKDRHQVSTIAANNKELEKEFFAPESMPVVQFTSRLNKSARMIAQQGIFGTSRNILTDQEAYFEEASHLFEEKAVFGKIIIPSNLKSLFAAHLRAMNITANSLFPGIDGLGRSITELVSLCTGKVSELSPG